MHWFPHYFNKYLLASTLSQAVNGDKKTEPQEVT